MRHSPSATVGHQAPPSPPKKCILQRPARAWTTILALSCTNRSRTTMHTAKTVFAARKRAATTRKPAVGVGIIVTGSRGFEGGGIRRAGSGPWLAPSALGLEAPRFVRRACRSGFLGSSGWHHEACEAPWGEMGMFNRCLSRTLHGSRRVS